MSPIPDVSVVTVHYNSGATLVDCLRSVRGSTREARVEHLVVDNASQEDGTLDRLAIELPDVRILRNEANLGFAGGSNRGIEESTGRYVLLLNPDTIVHPGGIDRMVEVLDQNPKVAVLGVALVDAGGKDQGVSARGFPTPMAFFFGRTTLLTRLFPNNRYSARFAPAFDPDRSAPYPVDWVSGACMMVRREAIDEIGPLDPGYFFMWEDADWCYRMTKGGWQVYCFHEAIVTHMEGTSRNRDWLSLWRSTVEFHRGAYRYYRRHINSRSYDPLHLVVVGALAGRGLALLVGRSITRIARQGPFANS